MLLRRNLSRQSTPAITTFALLCELPPADAAEESTGSKQPIYAWLSALIFCNIALNQNNEFETPR